MGPPSATSSLPGTASPSSSSSLSAGGLFAGDIAAPTVGVVGMLLLLALFGLWMRRRARQRRQGVGPGGPFSYLARNLRDYGWWPFEWSLQRDLSGHGPAEYVERGRGYHLQTGAERAGIRAAAGRADSEVQLFRSAPMNGYGQIYGGERGRRRNGVHVNTDHGTGNQRYAEQNLWQERSVARERGQQQRAAAFHGRGGAGRIKGAMQIRQAETRNPSAERATREGQIGFPGLCR